MAEESDLKMAEQMLKLLNSKQDNNEAIHQQEAPQKKFSCPKCTFSTNHQYSFKNHIRSAHGKVDELVCQHCDYIVTEPSHLVMHLWTKHRVVILLIPLNPLHGVLYNVSITFRIQSECFPKMFQCMN